jgi:selenide,water dikinase
VHDEGIGLDVERRTLACAQTPGVSYDWLSMDIGSMPDTASIENAQRFGLAVRPVEHLLAGVDALMERARRQAIEVAVVGAGAGGIELCLALDYRARREAGPERVRFSMVSETKELLPHFGEPVRKRVDRVLQQRGIAVHRGCRVIAAQEGGLLLEAGTHIRTDMPIWVTGPAAAPWLRGSGLNLDDRGFVLVDECLRSTSHPEVFAAGDVATMAHHARPKSGVYAVRQGPALSANLRRAVLNQPLRRFAPQRRALQLISVGERAAIASWGALAVEGGWVWRWKDWIDRRFIARYA